MDRNGALVTANLPFPGQFYRHDKAAMLLKRSFSFCDARAVQYDRPTGHLCFFEVIGPACVMMLDS